MYKKYLYLGDIKAVKILKSHKILPQMILKSHKNKI